MRIKGRAWRFRKRRSKHGGSDRPKNAAAHQDFVAFTRWLKQQDFSWPSQLTVANFKSTGRGLMTKQAIKQGQLLVSVPEKLLITSMTVMSSYLGPLIERTSIKPTALQVICLYLMCERAKGPASHWFPYIKVLPTTYTTPIYWEPHELSRLPDHLQKKARAQQEQINNMFDASKQLRESMVSSYPEFNDGLTRSIFYWAWCTVNTRAVYMEQKKHKYLDKREKDNIALAPFLDLLNHSPNVQVEAGFNPVSGCYEIKTDTEYKRYDQVFISYGPHNNARLLLEYGFTASDNPHNDVKVTIDEVLSAADHVGLSVSEKTLSLLGQFKLNMGLSCSSEGLSWNLIVTIKVLCMKALSRCDVESVMREDNLDEPVEKLVKKLTRKLLKIKMDQLYLPDDSKDEADKSIHEVMALNIVEEERSILNNCLL